MPRRNPDASSTVIAANLGWISSGLEAWGGKRKKTQTSLSPPYAQRISCDSRFATAGEGGARGLVVGWRGREGGRRSPAAGGRAAPAAGPAPLRGLPGPGTAHACAGSRSSALSPIIIIINYLGRGGGRRGGGDIQLRSAPSRGCQHGRAMVRSGALSPREAAVPWGPGQRRSSPGWGGRSLSAALPNSSLLPWRRSEPSLQGKNPPFLRY